MPIVRRIVIASLLATLFLLPPTLRAEEPTTAPATRRAMGTLADMPKDLADRIDKGIELLEAGKHKEFIEALMAPATLKKFQEKGDLDAVVKKFAEKKSAELLAIFKNAKGKQVRLSADGNRAGLMTEDGKRGPTMDKVDGTWYLGN